MGLDEPFPVNGN